MSIVKRDHPDGIEEVLAAALSDDDTGVETLSGDAAASREIMEPIPVYSLTLKDAANGVLPDGANPDSWRFLIFAADNPSIADIDAIPRRGAGELSFNRFAEGSNVDRLVRAVSVADRLFADEDSARYEVRLLEIPAINVGSVWLWSTDESIFIPYLDQERLKGVEPVLDSEFMNKVTSLARDRLGTLDGARN